MYNSCSFIQTSEWHKQIFHVIFIFQTASAVWSIKMDDNPGLTSQNSSTISTPRLLSFLTSYPSSSPFLHGAQRRCPPEGESSLNGQSSTHLLSSLGSFEFMLAVLSLFLFYSFFLPGKGKLGLIVVVHLNQT